ncbi:hypothetical protein BpHYR1_022779 [Brachionus plicatilis]|uniref:Uncharacterized protein n=1 Tax=Brachionus plicatilis TaxID=10195 RepID=A0A3M7QKC4_BRAPC|nr:hypothetical protein BpHYR1_022779 [Brachionus plicatilis]
MITSVVISLLSCNAVTLGLMSLHSYDMSFKLFTRFSQLPCFSVSFLLCGFHAAKFYSSFSVLNVTKYAKFKSSAKKRQK